MSTPKVGDRVRVVIEGEVVDVTSVGAVVIGTAAEFGWSRSFDPAAEHVKSIEVLHPPVETFGPGEVIEHKTTGEIIALTEAGYRSLRSVGWPEVVGEFFTWSEARTSEDWKRVTW